MNAFRRVIATLVFASAAAQAQEPAALTIACPAMQWPSQKEVGQALGIDNFTSTYAARDRVMQIARSQCLRGTAQVQIVADRQGSPTSLQALVAKK